MALSDINFDDLSNLNIDDVKKIGMAPLPVKIGLIIIVCAIVIAAGYFLDTTKQLEELKKTEAKEVGLKKTFSTKQAKAANLDAYKQQLSEMEVSFGALLRQLPNRTEIETLLTDISQTGISAGLDINYFKPEGLNPKEFYAEYPIKLKVTGRYHEFAEFVSGVAALPRIVTLRDFIIKPASKTGGVKLEMELTAVTYQYLDEETQQENAAAKKKGKKKGKKKKGKKKGKKKK